MRAAEGSNEILGLKEDIAHSRVHLGLMERLDTLEKEKIAAQQGTDILATQVRVYQW